MKRILIGGLDDQKCSLYRSKTDSIGSAVIMLAAVHFYGAAKAIAGAI